VDVFYIQLKNDLKNALVDLRIKGVKRSLSSFPNSMRIKLLYNELNEVCSNYLIQLGKIYIDEHLSFNRRKFGNYALGTSNINNHFSGNTEFRLFMQPIFQKLESYSIEKLKIHRYSFSEDNWLIVDINIQVPIIRRLDWSFLKGFVGDLGIFKC